MATPGLCAAQNKPHRVILLPAPEAVYLCVECYKVLRTVGYGKAERLSRQDAARWAVQLARSAFGRFTRFEAEHFNAGDPDGGFADCKAAVAALYEMLGMVESLGNPTPANQAPSDSEMPAFSKPAGEVSS